MIRFDQGSRRFNYRIVGVAIHDHQVLLHRAEHEPFWTCPGGRAEFGEAAEDTIRREMREELETAIDVVRLLWFVEDFFDYEGFSYHELALYFLIRFPAGSRPLALRKFDSADQGVKLLFQWFPIDPASLARLPLLPAFLPDGLANPPASMVHLVHRHEG